MRKTTFGYICVCPVFHSHREIISLKCQEFMVALEVDGGEKTGCFYVTSVHSYLIYQKKLCECCVLIV